ncbi:hypothetical protein SNE40_005930 [Patella caerulea]
MFLAQVASQVFVSPSDLTETYNFPTDIATQIVAELDIDGDGFLSRNERSSRYNVFIETLKDYQNSGIAIDFAELKEVVNGHLLNTYGYFYPSADLSSDFDQISNFLQTLQRKKNGS